MLLLHKFQNPQINLTLELFLRMVRDFFGDRLTSVVVFGSIVFDDLAPGYGDLDFLAVMEDDPDEETLQGLIDLRKPLRNGDYGTYAHMIEGPFLPKGMLDPAVTGKTVCWGTSGERTWDRNKLGCFVHDIIHKHGIIIYGEDIRPNLPPPTREQLLEECRQGCDDIRKYSKQSGIHSVDWLLLAARLLLWLREGRYTSKSGAADWGLLNCWGSWKEYLPMAKNIRKDAKLANHPDIRKWLDNLEQPILESSDELLNELKSV